MLEQQGGVCAICRRPPRPGVSLHVDHEHGSNRIRGLLHFQCNNLLGDAYDNAEWLRVAADYLQPPPDPELDDRVAARLAELMRIRDNRLFA